MTFTRFVNFATRFSGADWLTTIVVKAANSSLTTFAFSDVRAIESKTILRVGFNLDFGL